MHVIHVFLGLLLALGSFTPVWGVKPTWIVGIGHALKDRHHACVPSCAAIVPEKHTYVSSPEAVASKASACELVDEKAGGVVGNTLRLMKGALDAQGVTDYNFAMIGSVGADDDVFVPTLQKEGIAWWGQTLEAQTTGVCDVFLRNDTRSFSVQLGAAAYLDVETARQHFQGKGIRLCFLDGFLFSQLSRVDSNQLFYLIFRHVPRENRFLLLPSKEVLAQQQNIFLGRLLPHFAHIAGNQSEYDALFEGGVGSLHAYIQSLSKSTDTVFRVTHGDKGSDTFARGRKYTHDACCPTQIKTTSGAGDAYVAGFECARLLKKPYNLCGQEGAQLASQLIGGEVSL
ncbi:PfkB family carbohydrate kinase [Candidatus Hepatobacter penaei]|uniref:PfkB family carbohydrate kinase n=1 Tax=Candidatus Hepatobacter penaei TaxID=1274402 RepID=UPI0012DFED97|nr:PfkB family carbohydrate kinase [Candidatus Hepatobacter penaei]